MAHHKRRRPKHQRAGCLLCKPHKDERGSGEEKPTVRRKLQEQPKVVSTTGRVPRDPTWAEKTVAKMSDQEVNFWLKRLRGGDIW